MQFHQNLIKNTVVVQNAHPGKNADKRVCPERNDNHEKEVSVTITVNGEGYRAGYLTADVDDYYVLDQESNTSFHIYACVTELAVEVLDA